MTDYDQYAGIFTCQKILFGHTKSATILSRKPTLDKAVINQVSLLGFPIRFDWDNIKCNLMFMLFTTYAGGE